VVGEGAVLASDDEIIDGSPLLAVEAIKELNLGALSADSQRWPTAARTPLR
jgi:hypothetical protein